jgi:tRNA 2-thiouridine synthesizing protein A
MSKTKLDVTGLNCPLPILHARKFMQTISAGTMVEIRSSDPASVKDFYAFCRKTKSDLIEHREDGGIFTFNIRKGT